MLGFDLTFDSPGFLWLLAGIPILWYFSRRSLSGLGHRRAYAALLLRSVVITLVVFALAEAQIKRQSDRVAVMYLVDRSLSVDEHEPQTILDYLNRSAEEQRNTQRRDQAGVIVFGRKAAVEVPPHDGPLSLPNDFEAVVEPDATNLEDALKLAQAALPPDASKRVVVISDGNQNIGDVREQANRLAAEGIGIDVLPLPRTQTTDVAVEEIVVPADTRLGTPFEGRIVVENRGADDSAEAVSGKLRVTRTAGDTTEVISEQNVAVGAQKQVFMYRDILHLPNFYTYSAQFIPDDIADDQQSQNNRATAFTQIHGKGRVLLLEDWAKKGQFEPLAQRLRLAELDVTVQATDAMFTSLAELQPYDAVIMADVPRSSGEGEEKFTEISDAQVDMLIRNVQQLGSGLVVLGGPDSFGAGGWTNTPLEAALPVDLQVKNTKVVPVGALLLVIDKSGSMSGDKIAMSKAAAIAALRVLSDKDYLGVVAFDGQAQWVVPMQRAVQRDRIAASIDGLAASGGTDMEPALVEGYRSLEAVEGAAVRHAIVLTDGQTQGSNYPALAARLNARGITTSCVAIGQDSARELLNAIASAGSGKFYYVDRPTAIPRIFIKEARRIARPLVYENPSGIAVERFYDHPILQGVTGSPPPITGFVLTTPKDSPLVEIPLQSAQPTGRTNALLASWQFGLGRAAVLTTDAGQRWSNAWMAWEGYDKFFSQMVRWSMRPAAIDPDFTVFSQLRDGRVQLIVSALDATGDYLNFLSVMASVVGPNSDTQQIALEQVSPGRYVGWFDANTTGNYFVSVTSPGRAPVRLGVNVPYSAEFNDRHANRALLEDLASIVPRGGAPGHVIESSLQGTSVETDSSINVFRDDLPKVVSTQEIWPLVLLLASCVFLADVTNRRVLLSLAWMTAVRKRIAARLRRTTADDATTTEAIARLKARKDEVRQQYTAANVEPDIANRTVDDVLETSPCSVSPKPQAVQESKIASGGPSDSESYTERLLKVKQQVRDTRNRPDVK